MSTPNEVAVAPYLLKANQRGLVGLCRLSLNET